VTAPRVTAGPRPGAFRLRLSPRHLVAAGVLFVVEVVIALTVHDELVRPYVGDVLVVLLIHCALLALVDLRPGPTAVGVLGFAFAIEAAQLAGVGRLLDGHPVLQVVVGTTFQWGDLVAYAVGAALAALTGLTGLGQGTSARPVGGDGPGP
jgi:Protein of unknown function (DUF2809)